MNCFKFRARCVSIRAPTCAYPYVWSEIDNVKGLVDTPGVCPADIIHVDEAEGEHRYSAWGRGFARSLVDTRPILVIAWSPYTALKPPHPKSEFSTPKMPFRDPRKNGPQTQSKCRKWPLQCPKPAIFDSLIDFWGHFQVGPKWHFSHFKLPFLGFRGFGALQGDRAIATPSLTMKAWRRFL